MNRSLFITVTDYDFLSPPKLQTFLLPGEYACDSVE